MNKNCRFIIFIFIFIMLIVNSGCLSDENESEGGNKKVELTISNVTNETVQVKINVSFNDESVYNESVIIEPELNVTINEFDNGFGKYHIFIFVDNERLYENDVYISKSKFPPLFIIKVDDIESRQITVPR